MPPSTLCRLQDWGAVDGPLLTLRLNAPGLTTVRAVASRGDLPASAEVTCVYNVTPAVRQPCALIGEGWTAASAAAAAAAAPRTPYVYLCCSDTHGRACLDERRGPGLRQRPPHTR